MLIPISFLEVFQDYKKSCFLLYLFLPYMEKKDTITTANATYYVQYTYEENNIHLKPVYTIGLWLCKRTEVQYTSS